jgi:membrane protease subunit HflK
VLTIKVSELQQNAKVETNRALQFDVPIGITITELSIKETDVPDEAQEAFRRFNESEPAVRRTLSEAKAEQTNITGQAQLEKERAIGVARRSFHEIVKNAQGEAEAFLEQLEEYQMAPEITRQWMYLATMTKVMEEADQKILLDQDPRGSGGNTLNVLPLTDMFTPTPGAPARAATPAAGGTGGQR